MKKKSFEKKKLNNDNLNFSKIINKLDACISNNPKGIDSNWPKSFSELFYNKKLKEIYKRNKSPKIVEINQFNKYQLEVVSLKDSKTADPIVVELNITKL